MFKNSPPKLLNLLIYMSLIIGIVILVSSLGSSTEKFYDIKGWNVLDINMKLDEAKTALEDASIPFEEEMFHKTGEKYFTLDRNGWEGTVYFSYDEDYVDYISQILFQSPEFESENDAQVRISELEELYGTPKIKEGYSDENTSSTNYTWENENIILEVNLTYTTYSDGSYWLVWENYSSKN